MARPTTREAFKESAPLIDAIVTDVKANQKVTENTSTSEKQFLREETK